jgi:hypothetical protein
MRTLPISLFLLLLVLGMIGCESHVKTVTHAPVPSHNGHFSISIEVAPIPIRQMDKETFLVHLNDAHGKPLSGATVDAKLAMPSMDMGNNTVALKERFPGIYIGIGRFTMSGDWTVTVTATQKTLNTSKIFPFAVH